MYSCHSILECYNLFFGVELSVRSSCFILLGTTSSSSSSSSSSSHSTGGKVSFFILSARKGNQF